LDELRWGIPSETSVTNSYGARLQLQNAGIEIDPPQLFAGDTNAILALIEEEVDVVSVSFNPPLLPNYRRLWEYGRDDPEVWRASGELPIRSPLGYVESAGGPDEGGYRVRDARAALNDVIPNLFLRTRIIALTEAVPNGTVVYGPELPLALSQKVTAALQTFAVSEQCLSSICSADFYNWEGLMPATVESFAPLQALIDGLGLDKATQLATESKY